MPEPKIQTKGHLSARVSKAFWPQEGRFANITFLKLKKEYLWNNSRKKETEVGTGFFGTLSSFFVHVFDLQPSGTAFICGLRPDCWDFFVLQKAFGLLQDKKIPTIRPQAANKGSSFGHQVKKMPEKTRLSPKKARSDLRLFFSRIIPKNIPYVTSLLAYSIH